METLPDMAEEMNIGDYIDFKALQSLNEEDLERPHNGPARFWDVMVKEEHRNSVAVARPTIPETSDVRREVASREQSIFANWNRLNAILVRYEAVLRKRWSKKTVEQRRKVLVMAWPNMPTSHRPDFQALQRETTEERRAGSRFRNCFLWPHINTKDLTKARPLLLLLNCRGHYLPEVFVNPDYSSRHLGTTSGAIASSIVRHHTRLLAGEKTPETYGRIIPAKEIDSIGMRTEVAGNSVQPGEGAIVLEIQEKLSRFWSDVPN